MTKPSFRSTSIAMQEYLQAIFRLQTERSPVTTTGLAEHLDVAPASVTGMIRRLHGEGLVEHVPYQGVTLTQDGRREALRIIRIHRLWELFFTEVLDISWDEVHGEALLLEHVTSDRLADRLAEFLQQPQTDPHGQLIPSREGVLPARESLPLSRVGEGQRVRLVEVPDCDPELLSYLGDMALYPGAELRVVRLAPFGGPITIRLGEFEHVLGRELATQLLVKYINDHDEVQNE